jgi:hypothetical protein
VVRECASNERAEDYERLLVGVASKIIGSLEASPKQAPKNPIYLALSCIVVISVMI